MILLIDKPTGISSMDIIRILRKQWYPRKMWHAGTLDPLATGLMIICTEKDTKQINNFVWLDKTYLATIDFSQKSDTWDTEYRKEHEQLDVANLTAIPQEEIESTLDTIIGTHDLPLTPFSAKKVDGKKLYEYARAGDPIFMDVPMTLVSYNVISYNFPVLEIELRVWSGTYIRSIAHRLGKQHGLGGILTWLRRTSVGEFDVNDAKPLDVSDREMRPRERK